MNQVDLNLKKYEIEPNWVTFYFDEVSSNTHSMNVTHCSTDYRMTYIYVYSVCFKLMFYFWY